MRWTLTQLIEDIECEDDIITGQVRRKTENETKSKTSDRVPRCEFWHIVPCSFDARNFARDSSNWNEHQLFNSRAVITTTIIVRMIYESLRSDHYYLFF